MILTPHRLLKCAAQPVARCAASLAPLILAAAMPSSVDAALLSGKFFYSLGVSPDANHGTAIDVSADGNTVVGGEGQWGFRWTPMDGFQRISNSVGAARAVSADGTVIVGVVSGSSPDYRWILGVGFQAVPFGPQGFPPERLSAVSADGQTVLGYGYHPFMGNEIFTWTVGQPQLQLIPRVEGTLGGFAYELSDDASVIVGTQVAQLTPRVHRAARWVNGVGELISQAPNAIASEGYALSADGNVMGGQVSFPGSSDAYIWTQAHGMQLIGAADIGLTQSRVTDLSADGGVAVGAGLLNGKLLGFVWTEARGVVLADDLLTAYGIDLGGYTINGISGVSNDGRTFVGVATSPSGRGEPFIARIPEPSATTLAFMCVAVQRRWRRRLRPRSSFSPIRR